MKKSVIALALIGAFSGAAVAQSNVTMYGILDVNYMWQDLPTNVGTTAAPRVQLESFSAINGGHQSGNRWGVRGTEALGGGLNAIFDLEAGFNIDSGTSGQGGRLFGRQAYAGLSGNWGAVVAGRLATFSSGTGDFDMIGRVDPFSTGFGLAGAQSTFYSMNSLRLDNAFAYVSPVFSGFKVGIGYSTRIDGGEVAPSNQNTSGFIAGANWTYGPFFVAATYDAVNNVAGRPDQKHIQIGGTWDIASFRLHAAWADQSNIGAVSSLKGYSGDFLVLPAGISNFDNNAWMLGLTWTASDALKVFGSWQSSSADGQQRAGINFDPDYNVWGIGATYNLSRRTNLYTSYAQRNANGTLLDNSFNAKQFAVGVRHLF
jgi:predicted porin